MYSIHWTHDDHGSSLRDVSPITSGPIHQAPTTDPSVSRREWLGVIGAAAVAMPTPAQIRGHPKTATPPRSIPSTKGYLVEEIRGGLFWVTDGAYNTMFAVSRQGVIVVDPLPSLGARLLGAVAEVTRQPVTHVVYSHEHTDHIGAAFVLPSPVTTIAHQDTAAVLRRRADHRRPVPSVAFNDRYVLQVDDQTLVLEYRGVNHAPGNVFIYAPRQKVLMLVDVVYPGYMPYPDLGVAVDIPGYIQAHRDALTYEFTEFVGGHVNRLGTRADVEASLNFVLDLKRTMEEVLAEKPFPGYLRAGQIAPTETWFAHDDYEKERIAACFARLAPRWTTRLMGSERSLASHCRTMMVALAIQFGVGESSSTASPRKAK